MDVKLNTAPRLPAAFLALTESSRLLSSADICVALGITPVQGAAWIEEYIGLGLLRPSTAADCADTYRWVPVDGKPPS